MHTSSVDIEFDPVKARANLHKHKVSFSHAEQALRDPMALTTFFEIINGRIKADSGTYEWGTTVTTAYLPNDNSEYFHGNSDEGVFASTEQAASQGPRLSQFSHFRP